MTVKQLYSLSSRLIFESPGAGQANGLSGGRLGEATAAVKKIARWAVFRRRPPVGGSVTFLTVRGWNESKYEGTIRGAFTAARKAHPPQRACGEQPPEAALSEPQKREA